MSRQGPGLADLEKELVCSICTELLYQPLTLLDCLHTFCGSCLAEWFKAQGSRRSSGSSPRFTCPSCRAEVRGTRPNATVTTLLDMILVAHPDRVKSVAEKEEIAQRYNPGDSVFPAAPAPDDNAGDEDDDDRRLLEEVRELSLRESRAQARRENRRTGQQSRARERNSQPERQTDDGRSRRRREDDAIRPHAARPHGDERTRRIEHQSSLRSLLSLSDAETMEEEILRQIVEDGLLDDIDLDNLGTAQEEELTERIADAYRRRHLQRSHSRQGQERRQSPERQQARSQSARRSTEVTPSAREQGSRRPPVSRPHLFDTPAPPQRPGHSIHQRRNSEQASGRHRTSPVSNQASVSEDALRPAARSSSDMTTERSRSSQTGRVRSDSSTVRPRRATESEQNISDVWMGGGREQSSSRRVTSQSANNSPTSVVSPMLNASHNSTPTDHPASSLSSPLVPGRAERRSRPSSSRSNAPQSPTVQFTEPSHSCGRCGKMNIQYELHKRCPQCKEGNFHLCLRCYRSGRGCLQWNGFSTSARATLEWILASSNHRPPQIHESGHILWSIRYDRPPDTARQTNSGERQMTSDNPARRLQAGLFCDICLSSANECYWKCGQCNEGDWGFCNHCVNQGRCCTHPLLPIRRIAQVPFSSATVAPADPTNTPTILPDTESYKILSFSTNCDICTYPIPASVTRFHCLECNSGDYDVCTNCYLKLVATCKISKENGHNGWRRCLAGHRMIIVGFEDHHDGQRRVIVRDLVGGRALKDEHVARSPRPPPQPAADLSRLRKLGLETGAGRRGPSASRLRTAVPLSNHSHHAVSTSELSNTSSGSPVSQHASSFRRFPPNGGVGLIAHALWSWYPEEEVEDELVFPRGAEITEAENINDDWFWGCYAGRTGLFPGAHVRIVGEVAQTPH
ncbi:hypothetical protein NUU61_008536 [Penicillium alfredii]|uniref:RING-type domain-containing protein n=1 Tax=Penicillium alfredii TaxID=1506179 RepID=A0A9W9JWT4_9EURO|nr:uncharacterized protein NUU61_008536 [Penicillium alfredii]KAJ5083957.1 hypothetical protein NUU61_008536 [Penicillium alfredii]